MAAPFRFIDEVLRVGGNGRSLTGFTPPLDVRETGDEYVVMVDLPGIEPGDVTIEASDQVLTISGTRVPVDLGESQLSERAYGTFSRVMSLPQGVDGDTIQADCTNGVLTLRVPKPAQQKPRKIAINTDAGKAIEA
jgi:HSP20 family protein